MWLNFTLLYWQRGASRVVSFMAIVELHVSVSFRDIVWYIHFVVQF
jgi:hypothetical protein